MNTISTIETHHQTETVAGEALNAECGVASAECPKGKENAPPTDFLGWEGLRRRGKVARLSMELREELNTRLENGEEAKPLLEWLNGLPEVKQLLQEQFGGTPLSKQNLSEWRQGGFRDWLVRRHLADQADGLEACASEIEEQSEGLLVDHLATVVAARYAALMADWDGEATEAFIAKAKVLRGLCQDVVRLQRSVHRAAEQALKVEEMREKQALRAEQKEKNQRLAPILSAMRNRSLAAILGGGESAEHVASIINAVQHDTPLKEEKFQDSSLKCQNAEKKAETETARSPKGDRLKPELHARSQAQSNLVKPERDQYESGKSQMADGGESQGAEGTT